MPKRPRQHQLEDRSRLAFRSRLPSAWIFRDHVPDYGIDGEVEIFDSAGLGTGLRFLVQLKATDNPALGPGLKIPFRLDTFKYYRQLETPILIVRYHAPSDRIFARWFHRFDGYYARRGGKTVTFALAPEDEWTSSTADRLVSDLKAIRQLKGHGLPVPLTLRLVIEEDAIPGSSAADLRWEISTAAERIPRVINVAPDDSVASHATIRIGSEEFRASLSDVKGCTLHTGESYLSGPGRKSLSSDLFLALVSPWMPQGIRSSPRRLFPNSGDNCSRPSLRASSKAAKDRVTVNVAELLDELAFTPHVEVVAPCLPEGFLRSQRWFLGHGLVSATAWPAPRFPALAG